MGEIYVIVCDVPVMGYIYAADVICAIMLIK